MTQEFQIQRKLAAVFAADVEGFSRLMSADENGTLRELASQRAILDATIAKYRGRIANTAGDSVLAEFPSVSDAVECAVEAQEALSAKSQSLPPERRVQFRIGVHLGDVTTNGNDLLGNGVNIASRLQSIADPNGLIISAAAHDQVRKTLPLQFIDLGDQSLKGIGEEVRAFRLSSNATIAKTAFSPAEQRKPLPLPDKPSIAILPFQNMSSDPEQEYFADGMVDDIITALSRFKSLFVIARNSSFTYKGKAVDIKQVGRELGVRYVLEGSVRKAAGRVRITGQLIDAKTGAHLWADKFEGELANVFDLQDRVTEGVVGTIAPLLEAEVLAHARKAPTRSHDALTEGYLGLSALYRPANRDFIERALIHFRRAIAIDPDYAPPYGGVAMCLMWRRGQFGSTDPVADDDELRRIAQHMRDLRSEDAQALASVGFAVARVLWDLDAADEFIQQAVKANPNDAWVLASSGIVKSWRGESDTAILDLERALRLNPRDPSIFSYMSGMATAHFNAARHSEASAWAERAHRDFPQAAGPLRMAIVTYVWAGRVDDARRAMAILRKVIPDLDLQRFMDIGGPVLNPDVRQKYIDAARIAGLMPASNRSSANIGQDKGLPLPDKPSIAVLPFQNMSGDPEQEYFADGIVEDITTALSRFTSLFVIARNYRLLTKVSRSISSKSAASSVFAMCSRARFASPEIVFGLLGS